MLTAYVIMYTNALTTDVFFQAREHARASSSGGEQPQSSQSTAGLTGSTAAAPIAGPSTGASPVKKPKLVLSMVNITFL